MKPGELVFIGLSALICLLWCFYLVVTTPLGLSVPVGLAQVLCAPCWAFVIYKAFRVSRKWDMILFIALCELPFLIGYPIWYFSWIFADVFGLGINAHRVR